MGWKAGLAGSACVQPAARGTTSGREASPIDAGNSNRQGVGSAMGWRAGEGQRRRRRALGLSSGHRRASHPKLPVPLPAMGDSEHCMPQSLVPNAMGKRLGPQLGTRGPRSTRGPPSPGHLGDSPAGESRKGKSYDETRHAACGAVGRSGSDWRQEITAHRSRAPRGALAWQCKRAVGEVIYNTILGGGTCAQFRPVTPGALVTRRLQEGRWMQRCCLGFRLHHNRSPVSRHLRCQCCRPAHRAAIPSHLLPTAAARPTLATSWVRGNAWASHPRKGFVSDRTGSHKCNVCLQHNN